MSQGQPNRRKAKPAPVSKPTPEIKPASPAPPSMPVPPLFRKIDWLAFGVTTLLVFIGYYFTLAPDLTLEDAGEEAVASFYAGVPHAPGYPVWTIYSWLFTVLVPISNIAWRVALSSAVAGAFACGFLALLVSRGSSMMLEGIAELKNIERRWENAICIVSGFVSGMLLGFNGFMWSQAVIVEVYTFSVLSLVAVLCCLLRWMHAPEQRRYLYWAFFLFGICFTNHQTLIVAAMGIEVAIMARHAKLGRDLFLGNCAAYLAGLVLKANGVLTSFDNNPPLFLIYNVIGLGSLSACAWLALRTKGLAGEWKSVLALGALWCLGSAFYFFLPLTSMTNPPLNWAYPRTWEGFIHALTRGQYQQTTPTNSISQLFQQLWTYGVGATEEFSLVYLIIGLAPFLFYRRMQKRERAWVVGLSAIFLCLAVLLLILLNPASDRQSRDINRVFFTSSHVIIAMGIGYGLALIAATLATQYERYRRRALFGSAVAASVALFSYASLQNQSPLAKFTALFAFGLAAVCIGVLGLFRTRLPLIALLAVFAVMPAHSILSHWSDNEQRGHLFGFWFGHDMFTPPFPGPDGKLSYDPKLREEMLAKPEGKLIYPELARNTILFGGTDPGRFNPTYMIFCESFIPKEKKRDPNFDRRDVYLITQNALAEAFYLNYIRAHYNRSAQIDPPFFQEMFRGRKNRERGTTDLLARMVSPLDRFFTELGARVEQRRRKQGVYPAGEIITPTEQDLEKAYREYIADAEKRLQHDAQFPNEPKQIKPGEDIKIANGKIQINGQAAVMAINGLLTKVIFDKNPEHEFYVEESMALDWMYPYLSPFGIIMKLNRQPMPEFTEEMVKQDHEFWSRYSERLAGNWITSDTSVKAICEFAERVYLRRDFKDFQGDRKFVRDDQAQKSFSKLRTALGGLYSWRINQSKTPLEQQRMIKEADFAFRQAFAFCPYNLEVIQRYFLLLLSLGRLDDAIAIIETSKKFDEENLALQSWSTQLQQMKQARTNADPTRQRPSQ